jgi:hypothetical protein
MKLLDDNILKQMYYDSTYSKPTMKNNRKQLDINAKKEILEGKDSGLSGNPLISIKGYFKYFDKFNDDWLVTNEIDEKSTKFELKDHVIIIEFRDFPFYSYLELFIIGDEEVKKEILKNNVGTLNMKILNSFIPKKPITNQNILYQSNS